MFVIKNNITLRGGNVGVHTYYDRHTHIIPKYLYSKEIGIIGKFELVPYFSRRYIPL